MTRKIKFYLLRLLGSSKMLGVLVVALGLFNIGIIKAQKKPIKNSVGFSEKDYKRL